MKQHNLNAVRASHYPTTSTWPSCATSSGSTWSTRRTSRPTLARPRCATTPASVPRSSSGSSAWCAATCTTLDHHVVARQRVGRRTPARRGRSAGAQPGSEPAAALRGAAHARPLRAAPVTDVVCPMYTPIDEIVAWAESGRDLRRPLIMCEYSHAMATPTLVVGLLGGVRVDPRPAGGFIWEWVEHGLPRDVGADGAPVGAVPGGRISWGFRRRLRRDAHDANFICDGLVSADRVPHPAMREVHHVGRPVTVEPSSVDDSCGSTTGRWFSGLADLRARFELTVDGAVVERGELDVPEIAPRSSAHVAVPLRLPRSRPVPRCICWCAGPSVVPLPGAQPAMRSATTSSPSTQRCRPADRRPRASRQLALRSPARWTWRHCGGSRRCSGH